MRFIGIDLHYDSFVAAYLKVDGEIEMQKYYFADEKKFNHFINNLNKEDYIAVEASTNTFWFHRKVVNLVKKCFVINTSRFSIIFSTSKKTDKIDACKIAMKLRYKVLYKCGEEEFPTVYVPKKEVQELRTLFSTYELISKQRISTKNRIYSLFVQKGFCLTSTILFNRKSRESLYELDIPESTKVQIKLLYKLLDFLEEQKQDIKRVILKQGSFFKWEIDKLVSIKGISVFTAIAIMTDIADIKRFSNAKKLCSYLRTAPKIDSSNKSERIGCVNKQSRKLSLKMILQGLHHMYKSSPYLYKFYMKKRKGKKPGKVRIAIARKLFQGIYHMLKEKTYFYWTDHKGHKRKMEEYEKILKKLPETA